MKQKKNIAYYLRRALHYARRAVELGLFAHTPCPSGVVAEALAKERQNDAAEKRTGARQQPPDRGSPDRGSIVKTNSSRRRKRR
jgi:hypothetical protein